MLSYEMIINDAEKIVYKYYPEGKETFGTVFINKKTKEYTVDKLASNDEAKTYLMHMFSQIRKFITENHFKEKGMIAWY